MKKIIAFGFVFSLLFASTFAHAATTPNSIVTAQTPNIGVVQFLQGTDSAGTYKTLYTAGTNGSIIKALYVNSNDASAAHLVTCQVKRSTVLFGGVAVNIPINSGFANAIPPVNLMAAVNWVGLPLDSDSNPYLLLNSGDLLQCTYATTLTSSDLVNVQAIGADF